MHQKILWERKEKKDSGKEGNRGHRKIARQTNIIHVGATVHYIHSHNVFHSYCLAPLHPPMSWTGDASAVKQHKLVEVEQEASPQF